MAEKRVNLNVTEEQANMILRALELRGRMYQNLSDESLQRAPADSTWQTYRKAGNDYESLGKEINRQKTEALAFTRYRQTPEKGTRA